MSALTKPVTGVLAALCCFLLTIQCTVAANPTESDGKVRICVPEDFKWVASSPLELPLGLIFEDSGFFSGSPTQSDTSYIRRLKQTGSNDVDGRPLEGAFITTAPVKLSRQHPCVDTDARMFIGFLYTDATAHASWHHGWLGWRVIGHSIWHDDFGKLNGLPISLGTALDDFQVRGMLLTDLGN